MKEGADERLHSGFAINGNEHVSQREVDLSALANQLNAIAAELRGDDAVGLHMFTPAGKAERSHLHCVHDRSDAQDDLEQRRAIYAKYARAAYATRRRRTTIFGDSELFGEPAWDILLDLYIAHIDDKPVSVSSACIGSAAPPTTGLRWLGLLADRSLVTREHDPDDQRRVLVRLTERGLAAMDEFFASAGLPV